MPNPEQLKADIFLWGEKLGFQQLGVSDVDLGTAESRLTSWLESGQHGDMDYMRRHGSKRSRPGELVPGTVRVISARMDYLPHSQEIAKAQLDHPSDAYVSRYALGRDYHKLLRKRLQQLASRIEAAVGSFGYRVFVDSAPVLEKPLAEKAGLGWIGKHTNLLHDKAGSWFFLGEVYTDLPLPVDAPASSHCGTCRACIDVCPTKAITGPYQLDARRCISYLTIEKRDAIPVEFRKAMGNRIYGCDDCQLFCPWNKFARVSDEADFKPRHGLDNAALVDLFGWSEATWLKKTEGSAIRRIGFDAWLRNVAVALGNAATTPAVIEALTARIDSSTPMVKEHIVWALQQHDNKPETTHV
ncbi:MAG: tRNA epoxyqueuosine(34) reductase QueG [Gammaproteobacteria bacterium]|nr:tRNA epoxyqueuosine(34) reductase QueG [Gammaproteobacteria bacterium]